jgi:aminopeptidase N
MRFITIISIVLFSLTVEAQSHRDSLDILHYTLNVDISKIGTSKIWGCAEIKAKAKYNLNIVSLDLYKLTTDSAFFEGEKVSFIQNDTLVRLLNCNINKDDTIILKIYYNGAPKKDPQWGGFYFMSGIAFNMGVGMSVYPHGIGRYWYPCLDSFTDKATYDFYIKTSEQNNAVCGGLFMGKTFDTDNKPIYHWKLNQPIPTYLSSVAVGPFIKISDTYHGIERDIPIEIFVEKEDSTGAVNVFKNLKQTMSAYEEAFGAYQWDRIGYVVVPFGSGAMEHATNIAFPNNSLSGGLSNQTLAAHELSHSWFGNQVTTATSEDMWLNEGWATFCETWFKEKVFSKETSMTQVLSNHKSVITLAHISDGGYYPLNKIPHNITYGKTVYDKGADIVYNLRYYLGDNLFFEGVKQYLQTKKYGNATSEELQQILSDATGVDLSGFFNNWVYQTGYPHYSVDSFYYNNSQITVALKEKLNHRENFGNMHRVPLTFFDNNWNRLDTVLQFNGEKQSVTINTSFNPKALFIDLNQQLNDATTHDNHVVSQAGYVMFKDCDFKLNTLSITDSALIQVIYNYAVPDNFLVDIPGVVVANYHYWTVNTLISGNFNAKGIFSYYLSKNTNPDNGYEIGNNDTIVMLYRENMAHNWRIIKKGNRARVSVGDIYIEHLKKGEYTLGYWDGVTPIDTDTDISDIKNSFNIPVIYPNPVNDILHIKNINRLGFISIFNQQGVQVYSKSYTGNSGEAAVSVNNLSKGIYYIIISGNTHKAYKFVKQ